MLLALHKAIVVYDQHRNVWSEIPPSVLGRFQFVSSGRPKTTGSGQFKWKGPRHARTILPALVLQIPELWPTGAGELSGSDPWAGQFWTEPVLRARAFHLRTNWFDRQDRTNGKQLWAQNEVRNSKRALIYFYLFAFVSRIPQRNWPSGLKEGCQK